MKKKEEIVKLLSMIQPVKKLLIKREIRLKGNWNGGYCVACERAQETRHLAGSGARQNAQTSRRHFHEAADGEAPAWLLHQPSPRVKLTGKLEEAFFFFPLDDVTKVEEVAPQTS